jgi:hypothetical protein
MNVEDLCEIIQGLSLPSIGEKTHPDLATVQAIRAAVTEAVVDDAFLADCFAHELRVFEQSRIRVGLVPFYTMAGTGVRFALGYWAPGATPGPHEHTAWTVTAVCRNELEVVTFDRCASYQQRQLVPKNRFEAPAGKVGYIFDPCIHAPANTSSAWSLSLHITSPRDGEQLCDYDETVPGLVSPIGIQSVSENHPYAKVIIQRQRLRYLHLVTTILAKMNLPHASNLLQECYRMGSTPIRRLLAKLCPAEAFETETNWLLERTRPDLEVNWCTIGDRAALYAETNHGTREEISVASEAQQALAFAADCRSFYVQDLPGALSVDERCDLGDALEETGLFRRVIL